MSVTARLLFEFEDSYAREVPELSVPWTAASFPAPRLLVLNEELAAEMGVEAARLREPEGVELLVGAVGEGVTTTAQAYAGHQFGGYVPRLGDGRALLLGEVLDRHGQRRDLHLKGSGRTPFARGGDGLAAIGPMLREYLMGEAMYALGIPTTRALAVVATGQAVVRETMLPGAVLARVAASHLRVGTFQYAAALAAAGASRSTGASGARDSSGLVRTLADYAIARHHPEAAGAPNPYLDLYRRVIDAQASLVARWMLVGFVHGVMNTDNMTISGQTIDYGPCAFLDSYDPATVFSSIDHAGRYAFGNQPHMAQWNLARLGETLLPLIEDDREAAVEVATDAMNSFAGRYAAYWASGMAAKLGLVEADQALTSDLLALLGEHQVDFTRFFRALSSVARGDAEPARALFTEPDGFDAWAQRWRALLPPDRAGAADAMDRINPIYIPRNHLVEQVLTAATAADLAPFERLVDVLAEPFDERPGLERYAVPAPEGHGPHVTYCGT